jgi:hypothetical protein
LSSGDEVLALANPQAERGLRDAIVGTGQPGSTPQGKIDGATTLN